MIDCGLSIARWIGALAFVAIFVAFIGAVFMRYVIGQPIQWSDEFVTIAAIWTVFWMSAFVIRDRDHVSVDLVYALFGPRGRRILSLVSAVFFGSVFAAALPSIIDYVLFLSNKHTDILEWRLNAVFMCLPMFFAAIVARSLVTVVRLLSPSWRTHVGAAPDGSQVSGSGA